VRRRLVGQQEQQIDVGIGRELAAAVAANRDHGHALARGRIGGRIDVADGEIVEHADELIHQEGERVRGVGARAVLVEALADLGAAGGERLLEEGDELLRRRRALGGELLECRLKRAAIHHRARPDDTVHGASLHGRSHPVARQGRAAQPRALSKPLSL
jgi:hypothetical protein